MSLNSVENLSKNSGTAENVTKHFTDQVQLSRGNATFALSTQRLCQVQETISSTFVSFF